MPLQVGLELIFRLGGLGQLTSGGRAGLVARPAAALVVSAGPLPALVLSTERQALLRHRPAGRSDRARQGTLGERVR